jgi:hypothetical protein
MEMQEAHEVNGKQEGVKRKEVESKESEEKVNVKQEDSKKEEERSVEAKWEDKKTKLKVTNLRCICSVDDFGLLDFLKHGLKSSINNSLKSLKDNTTQ